MLPLWTKRHTFDRPPSHIMEAQHELLDDGRVRVTLVGDANEIRELFEVDEETAEAIGEVDRGVEGLQAPGLDVFKSGWTRLRDRFTRPFRMRTFCVEYDLANGESDVGGGRQTAFQTIHARGNITLARAVAAARFGQHVKNVTEGGCGNRGK